MSDFTIYLKLGFQHITDFNGLDHILFILALCAVFQIEEWRKILLLVTAFTFGHSITLGLATLKILKINENFVEFLIPITILITCFVNFLQKTNLRNSKKNNTSKLRYYLALFFGLIHGMGFSNYLRSLLGKEESIFKPLLAFNIGLELGQILIVVLALIVSTLITRFFGVKQHDFKIGLTGIIVGMTIILLKNLTIFS
jgi:HupE / UreJ protein